MIIKFPIFFLIIFYSAIINANKIRVLDFEFLIENNPNLINLYSDIENDQLIHKDNFKKKEKELNNELNRIEKLKLILDNDEFTNEINKYNQSLNNFNIEIEKFNNFYEMQINELKNLIINNLVEIIREYSINNQIDLISDSNSYILSNNSINITDLILDESNKLKLEFSFEKYK